LTIIIKLGKTVLVFNIDNDFHNLGEKMAQSIKSSNVIKVCQGPGCRAWGAQGLMRRIRELSKGSPEKPKICSSACMNRCGGGTSVEVVSRRAFVKIKNSPEQLQSMLCTQPAMS
jgi:hypothetical protein